MENTTALSYVTYSLGALVCVVAAIWIARRGDPARSDRWAGMIALILTANWCIAQASLAQAHPVTSITYITANFAWIFVLFRLFANDGRDESLKMVRPAVVALAFVEALQGALLAIGHSYSDITSVTRMVAETSFVFRMLTSIGAIVLLHNLYVGAAQPSRRMLRWNTAALAGLWVFTLNFNTIGYISGTVSPELAAFRGLAVAVIAVPFAFGFMKQAAGLSFQPSRTVAFRSLSLLLISVYLIIMIGLAAWLEDLTAGGVRLTQVSLVVASAALMLVWLPSHRLRGWLRVTAVKHLFKHRYDYRAEWMRFTKTIGRSPDGDESLHERSVRAIADITDSPAGVLILADDSDNLDVASHWHWAHFELPQAPFDDALKHAFVIDGYILDLEQARRGHADKQGSLHAPAWLLDLPKAWAVVPLCHFDRLVGLVVLAQPAVPRTLDWEDFDLLGVIGRQLASYISEQAGQEALSEAARFDDFNRRMAFIMHDIKNISSQTSLLLKNAERHVDKPEFRQDMLVTLRNSADKLNTMLSRLGHYGTQMQEEAEPFDLSRSVANLVARYSATHRIVLVGNEALTVNGQRNAFEQAIAHLVQNAIDASVPGVPVMIETYSDGLSGVVEIVDSGVGMSAEFLRTGLFKPFVSSKEDGFGIGAFEARELIRGMGGRIDVVSREGLGTRFKVVLSLKSARDIFESAHRKSMKEVA